MKKVLLYALIAMLSFGCEKPEEPKIVNPDTPSVTSEDPNKKPDQPNEDPNKNPGDKPNEDPNNNNTEDPNKTEEQPEEKVEEKTPDPKINWDNYDSTDYELSSDGLTLLNWKNRHTRNLDMSKDPKLANVTKIAKGAFSYAGSLENIFISNKVTIIGNTAFESSSLKSIVMSNSVTTIEYGAFMFSSDLVNIDFSSSLTTIENSAFEYCENIKALVLPKTLTNIGQSVFNACSAVTEITLKMTKVPAYPNGLLEGADALQKIYVPADLVESYKTTAGWSEFAGKFEAIKK